MLTNRRVARILGDKRASGALDAIRDAGLNIIDCGKEGMDESKLIKLVSQDLFKMFMNQWLGLCGSRLPNSELLWRH